ncbi:MAG: hypothetical protein RL686_1138, partial [Pseudomonadota bacterium]
MKPMSVTAKPVKRELAKLITGQIFLHAC